MYWRMRQRRETAEHRFATLKMSMGHAEDEHGGDAIPDEASAQGRHRDGAAKP